jgi:uncharacterized membrane protein HdeD (DUF308 family)
MKVSGLKTVKTTIKNWYIPMVVGLIFLILGLYCIVSPVESFRTLSLFFSMAFIISGVSEIIFSISNKDEIDNWGWTLMFGLVTLIIGLLIFNRPDITFKTLSLIVGITLLFRSISSVSHAIDLKSYGEETQWKTLLGIGIIGVILSVVLLWNPLIVGGFVSVLIGLTFSIIGIFSMFLALKLKALKNRSQEIKQNIREKAKSFSESNRDF